MSEDKALALKALEEKKYNIEKQIDELGGQVDELKAEIYSLEDDLTIVIDDIKNCLPSNDKEKILRFYDIVAEYLNSYPHGEVDAWVYYRFVLRPIFGAEYKTFYFNKYNYHNRVPIPDKELTQLLRRYNVEYTYEIVTGSLGHDEVVFSTADNIDNTHKYSPRDFKLISL